MLPFYAQDANVDSLPLISSDFSLPDQDHVLSCAKQNSRPLLFFNDEDSRFTPYE
jgi:hypothetical protein